MYIQYPYMKFSKIKKIYQNNFVTDADIYLYPFPHTLKMNVSSSWKRRTLLVVRSTFSTVILILTFGCYLIHLSINAAHSDQAYYVLDTAPRESREETATVLTFSEPVHGARGYGR